MYLDEAELQNHLMAALCEYSKIKLMDYSGRFFSNPQQSTAPAKFIADFCFTLEKSRFYAVELKVLKNDKHQFKSPNMQQWRINKILAKAGLPIYYMYNNAEKISGMHCYTPPAEWAKETLMQVSISSPPNLPSPGGPFDQPDMDHHDFALSLFSGGTGKYPYISVGAILRLMDRGYFSTNRILTLVYARGSRVDEFAHKTNSGLYCDELTPEKARALISVLQKANQQNSAEFSNLSDEELFIVDAVLQGTEMADKYVKMFGIKQPQPVPQSKAATAKNSGDEPERPSTLKP